MRPNNLCHVGWILLFAAMPVLGQVRYESGLGSSISRSNVSAAASTGGKSSLSAVAGPMRITPGDLLNVTVFDTPELSGQFPVGENGVMAFPLIGKLSVNGLWPEQAQHLIEKQLRDGDFVKNPQVTVVIAEYAGGSVTIIGEVSRPGIYPLVSGDRLFDVVSMASGVTPLAGTKVKITHRGQPDKPVELTVRDVNGQLSPNNVELIAGDTIIVQRAGIIYVLGDVGKPGGFVMDRENITALEAIALAQGTTKTSSINKARLLRRRGAGVDESALPLKSILQAKHDDPVLQNGDIIYVPGSIPKNAMQMGLQGILSSVAGASIYVASGR